MSEFITKEMTIKDFEEVLSSKAPVPGGGGAAGLVSSVAASLGAMVGNLTTGKKKYAEYQAEIDEMLIRLPELRDALLDACDKDAEVFKPLSEAYGLPKDTPEQIEYKDRVMEEALFQAANAPLHMMSLIEETLVILDRLADIGSKLAISDVGVGAAFARAAANSAVLNVFINTKLMKKREIADDINSKAYEILERCNKLGESSFSKVWEQLRP